MGQHHGDLRRALLDAALARLRSGAPLSLRGVADDAGVSPAAPYHHFESKEGLVAALASDAFDELDAALAAAHDAPAATAAARLRAMAAAYVRFGLADAARYRQMWTLPPLDDAHPELEARALQCFERLSRAVTAVRDDGDVEGALRFASLGWALAHGFVLLAVDGVWQGLPSSAQAHGRDPVDDVADAVVRLVR